MKEEEIISLITNVLSSFVDGKIDANKMISEYNIIIRDYFPWGTDNEKLKIIEQFQNQLAFFVENPQWRKEDKNYYGPAELNDKVRSFLSILNN
jgi:hypothetical protein